MTTSVKLPRRESSRSDEDYLISSESHQMRTNNNNWITGRGGDREEE